MNIYFYHSWFLNLSVTLSFFDGFFRFFFGYCVKLCVLYVILMWNEHGIVLPISFYYRLEFFPSNTFIVALWFFQLFHNVFVYRFFFIFVLVFLFFTTCALFNVARKSFTFIRYTKNWIVDFVCSTEWIYLYKIGLFNTLFFSHLEHDLEYSMDSIASSPVISSRFPSIHSISL